MRMLDGQWRSSTRSGGNGACVEARYTDRTAQVRDSKDRTGPVLSFAPARWTGFIEGVKAGLFDA